MRGLFLERGRGKTTASIYTSAMTGCPIIAATENSKGYIKEMAKKLGVVIPDPVAIRECTRGKEFPNGVLIDNAEAVIRTWARENLNAPVVAFTMTTETNDQYKSE